MTDPSDIAASTEEMHAIVNYARQILGAGREVILIVLKSDGDGHLTTDASTLPPAISRRAMAAIASRDQEAVEVEPLAPMRLN